MTETPRDLSQADWMFERIVRSLTAFEESLTPGEEVGIRFAAWPGDSLRIENVGFWNPDLIKFTGQTGDGARYEIIQHAAQVNLLLVALPKMHQEPRRIGFNLAEQLLKTKESVT